MQLFGSSENRGNGKKVVDVVWFIVVAQEVIKTEHEIKPNNCIKASEHTNEVPCQSQEYNFKTQLQTRVCLRFFWCMQTQQTHIHWMVVFLDFFFLSTPRSQTKTKKGKKKMDFFYFFRSFSQKPSRGIVSTQLGMKNLEWRVKNIHDKYCGTHDFCVDNNIFFDKTPLGVAPREREGLCLDLGRVRLHSRAVPWFTWRVRQWVFSGRLEIYSPWWIQIVVPSSHKKQKKKIR